MSNAPSSTARDWPRTWAIGLVALMAALASLRSISNADFWTHLESGRQWLGAANPAAQAADLPAVMAEARAPWLYNALTYLLWQTGGATLVLLAQGALVATALTFVLRAMRASATSLLWSGLAAAWIAMPLLVARPSVWGLSLAGITYGYLYTARSYRRLLYCALSIQLLWPNIHASFLAGPLLALFVGLDTWQRNKVRGGDRNGIKPNAYFGLAGLMFLASLANPKIIDAHIGSLLALAKILITSSQATFPEWTMALGDLLPATGHGAVAYLVLTVIAIGFILHGGRLPLAPTALGIGGLFVLFFRPQFAEWSALMILPFLALSCEAISFELRAALPLKAAQRVTARLLPAAAILLCGAFVVVLVTGSRLASLGSSSTFGLGVDEAVSPEPALTACKDAPGRPLHFLAVAHSNAWEYLAATAPAGGVVVNTCRYEAGVMSRFLQVNREWELVYFDGASAVLMPPSPALTKWRQAHPEVQRAGIKRLADAWKAYEAAIDTGHAPRVPARIAGAAQFLRAQGRFREASYLYELLTRGNPQLAYGWMNFGFCLMREQRTQDAIRVLEFARTMLSHDPRCYLLLSRAYKDAGDAEKSAELYEAAKAINRRVTEALENTAAASNQVPALKSNSREAGVRRSPKAGGRPGT